MRITILGTRGEIKASKPYHSRHSGALIDGELMLDLGEQEYLQLRPRYIFISHLHPDHAFFVRNAEPPPLGRVFTPDNFHEKTSMGTYTIQPIPTHHSVKVPSQAYLIEKQTMRVLYTGDLIWINKEYHHLLQGLDLVITEASFLRRDGMIRREKKTGRIYGHAGVPNLVNLFSRFTGKIVFMHFGSWFYHDVPEARKRLQRLSGGVELIAAYDGMQLHLP